MGGPRNSANFAANTVRNCFRPLLVLKKAFSWPCSKSERVVGILRSKLMHTAMHAKDARRAMTGCPTLEISPNLASAYLA